MRWWYAVAVAVCLPACGGGERAEVAAVVDTVAGVTRLSYPVSRAPRLSWSLDSLTAIGDALGEDAYQFDQVLSAGLAGAGDDLLVLDRAGSRVLRYDIDGTHRATYGRRGGGPGELEQPLALGAGGDTAWVADFGNTRYTGYPLSGGEPRDVRFPDGLGVPTGDLAVTGAGLAQAFLPPPGFGPGGGGPTGAGDGTVPLLRVSGTSGGHAAVLDTLWRAPAPTRDLVELESQGRVMVMVADRSFAPDLRWAALPDGGIVLADGAAYELTVLDAEGAERLRIRRDPPPRATTDADREAARERVREAFGDRSGVRITRGGPGGGAVGGDALLEQRLASMTFAEVIPRITRLAVDPAGHIWVGVSEEEPGEVDRIDVYDADGELLGELRGQPFPDLFYGRDRAARLVRDELDVQRIILYRLRTGEADRPPTS